MQYRHESIAEIFHQEYRKALSFLEENSFACSVSGVGEYITEIVYTKGCVAIVISLDIRDIAIASVIRIGSRGLQGRGFLYDLLTAEERADPEIQTLLERWRSLLRGRIYRDAVRTRSEELVRQIIQAEAEMDATILRKYRGEIIARAKEIARQLYGSAVEGECQAVDNSDDATGTQDY